MIIISDQEKSSKQKQTNAQENKLNQRLLTIMWFSGLIVLIDIIVMFVILDPFIASFLKPSIDSQEMVIVREFINANIKGNPFLLFVSIAVLVGWVIFIVILYKYFKNESQEIKTP